MQRQRLGLRIRIHFGLAGAIAALGLCSIYVHDAHASNVTEFPDNGSEQMARGGAWIARASDPLATTFNPAGLAGQPTRLTIQSSFIFHHTCFSRIRAAGDTSQILPETADANGRFPRVCNDVEMTLNPQFGGTLRFTEKLSVGLLVIGPSSAGEKNWPEFIQDGAGTTKAAPQRYLLTRQAGIILFPTLGVGYEVIPNLRLGASFGWGFAKVKNTTATVALGSGGQSPDNDVRANLQVRDYFIPRVSGGLLWSIAPEIDIAGWYQWTDTIKATGDLGTATNYYSSTAAKGDQSGVRYADTIFDDCGTGRAGDVGKCGSGDNAKVKFVIPMEAKVGFRYHKPRVSIEEAQEQAPAAPGTSFRRDPLANDLFDAEINLTWANNSAIDAIEVGFPTDRATGQGSLPVAGINSTIPPNADQARQFKDVYGVRVGGDFNALPDRLAIRAGAFFETSGARDQFQHIDFAPSQRIGFGLGGTYRIRLGSDPTKTSAIEIMVGYGHVFYGEQSRTDPSASGLGAVAGTACGDGTQTGPNKCSDGSQPYRTKWPVNLGTITNALNVINVGASYRF